MTTRNATSATPGGATPRPRTVSEAAPIPVPEPLPVPVPTLNDHVKQAVAWLRENKGSGDDEKTGTGAHNCKYGAVSSKGKLSEQTWMCHRQVSNLVDSAVMFNLTCRNTQDDYREAGEAYLDWVMDTVHSPWKEALPKTPYILDEVNLNSKEFMLEYGFVFWHVDVLPSNVQHQILVAARTWKEWPHLISAWHTLVKDYGFTREWAYAFLTLWVSASPDNTMEGQEAMAYQDFFSRKEYRLTAVNFYDFPLDVGTCEESYVLNFLGHNMTGKKNKPFSMDSKYTPVNSLWGENQVSSGPISMFKTDAESISKRYVTFLKEKYKSLGTEITVKTGWNETRVAVSFNKETMLRIGQEEQQRLYGILEDRKKAA